MSYGQRNRNNSSQIFVIKESGLHSYLVAVKRKMKSKINFIPVMS